MSEVESLLNPISAEQPSGADMVFSAEFDQIEKARYEDDPNLEQGEWIAELKEADWPLVIKTATTLLTDKTKDIRVGGWLFEAWIKREGFAGLAKGFALLDGLCRNFWDTLYPQVEEGDAQQRAANLAWIVNRTREHLVRIPLTKADDGKYGHIYWEAANKLAHEIRRNPGDAAGLSQGRVTLERFDEARRRTSPDYYAEIFGDIGQSQINLRAFEEVLLEKLGDEAPSFSQIHQSLDDVESLVVRLGRESGVHLSNESEEQHGSEGDAGGEDGSLTDAALLGAGRDLVSSHIRSRREALAQLKKIAAFFRETEPHSPVAYLAEKAAMWADMPLHVWLKAVVRNNEALSSLEEILGVANPHSGEQ